MTAILLKTLLLAPATFLLSLLLFPSMIKFSINIGWVDKPNHRKLHVKPIPVTGGIGIVLVSLAGLFFSGLGWQLMQQYPVIIPTAVSLLLMGIWDDRKNISPKLRLLLEFAGAGAVAASGIRLTSLYGLFGIGDLPVAAQYIITIIIIAGVVNAFNLMDGIDGLAGGLALINLLFMGMICFLLHEYYLLALLTTLAGALAGFLRYNMQPARIFMGDGGSLFLGFLMPVLGILLIERNAAAGILPISKVLLLIASIMVVPVFDSLRVYAWRISRGESPFKADKSHLHHLFLLLGLNHKKTAFIIYLLEIMVLALGWWMQELAGISIAILIITAVFLLLTQVLQLNHGMTKWSGEIRKLENM